MIPARGGERVVVEDLVDAAVVEGGRREGQWSGFRLAGEYAVTESKVDACDKAVCGVLSRETGSMNGLMKTGGTGGTGGMGSFLVVTRLELRDSASPVCRLTGMGSSSVLGVGGVTLTERATAVHVEAVRVEAVRMEAAPTGIPIAPYEPPV